MFIEETKKIVQEEEELMKALDLLKDKKNKIKNNLKKKFKSSINSKNDENDNDDNDDYVLTKEDKDFIDNDHDDGLDENDAMNEWKPNDDDED